MITKYVIENDYDVIILDNEQEALKTYEAIKGRQTQDDLKHKEYLRLYEIQAENSEAIDNTSDLSDLLTKMIDCVK